MKRPQSFYEAAFELSVHNFRILPVVFSVFVLILYSASALAIQQPKHSVSALAQKQFSKPELQVSSISEPLKNVRHRISDAHAKAHDRFTMKYGQDFQIHIDPRSGTPTNIIGHIPVIPGSGKDNHLKHEHVSQALGRKITSVDVDTVSQLTKNFIKDNQDILNLDVSQVGNVHAEKVTDHLWQVHVSQEVNGVNVRNARLAATISHGNLILIGTERWGKVKIDTTPKITAEEALKLGFQYVEGQLPSDQVLTQPALEIVPIAPLHLQDGDSYTGPMGEGYDHRLVWTFTFKRPLDKATWEVMIDAQTGEVLSFKDINQYALSSITGGAYPLTSTEVCPAYTCCGTMQDYQPMPFADTGLPAPNNFTNSAGLFEYESGNVVSTLFGKYVRIQDGCGSISESVFGSGGLNLGGATGQHDCVSGGSSVGNTAAARSSFYEINRMQEMARGFLPNNSWLQGTLTANVNLPVTSQDNCNAYWSDADGSVNFYQSGYGCRNTGEIAGMFDHEWGHGLDYHDGNGYSNPSESYADIAAMYRLQSSCMGYGFFSSWDKSCGQTSDGTGYNTDIAQNGAVRCALNCSGVRETDWDQLTNPAHTPDTPANFVCSRCGVDSYGDNGPCGKEVHCESAVDTEAAWDFAARDLQSPPFSYDSNTAFIIANKIFYQAAGNIGNWHTCSCGSSTSNGCGATNAYMQWLAADDDDGDISNGTPHMTALYNAFNRHGIACDTPAPVSSGCSGAPSVEPVLTATPGSNQVGLSWTADPAATKYSVFRTEGVAGCNTSKTLIATVTGGTTYADVNLANDRQYCYSVMAVGASNACFSPASACVCATPALGPHGTLQGTVTNSTTGNPINGATVTATGGYTTTTNGSGAYQFAYLPEGSYDVDVVVYGYQPLTQTAVIVTAGGNAILNFALSPLSTSDNNLTILTPTTLPLATVSMPYSRTLAATGGLPPYSWSITAGALPDGLTLNGATGKISGDPTASGIATFTVQVLDSNASSASRQLILPVNASGGVGTEWVAKTTVPGTVLGGSQVVADAAGNVYTIGTANSNGGDFLTIKYSPEGVKQWEARYNDAVYRANSTDTANDLAVDGQGNVYVTGGSKGASGSTNFATVKYNADGVQQWVARYEGSSNANALRIALDSTGNVYVGGTTTYDFGNGYNFVVIKYSSSGSQLWIKGVNGTSGGDDFFSDMCLDGSGNVYLAGRVDAYDHSSTGDYHQNYGVLKFDTNGNQLWFSRYDGLAHTADGPTAITVDADGNVFVTGFSDTQAYSGSSGIYYDYATVKFNSSGVQQWVARYNGPGSGMDYPTSIALDGAGNVFVTGSSAGSGSGYDFATIKYNSAGVQQWVKRYNGGGNGDDGGAKLLIDPFGNVYVAGTSMGAASGKDFVTIKYDTDGNELWVKSYNGPTGGDDIATSMAKDMAGNFFVAGYSTDPGKTSVEYAVVKFANNPILINPLTLPPTAMGLPYSQTISAMGGLAPYSWSITSGSLPAGLTLAGSSGVISGTTTVPGIFTFTVQTTDANSFSNSKMYALSVLGITTASLPNAAKSIPYNTTLTASGGLPPYSWSITAGAFPVGLTLNGATGVISGTPTSIGTTGFTIQVSDANSTQTSKQLSLIAGSPDIVTVQGRVTDGSGHGWPLYAAIAITSTGYSNTIYTDPATGQYAIDLIKNVTYEFNVSAISQGYSALSRNVTPSVETSPQDFNLAVDSSCTATGYAGTSFENDNAGFTPSGTQTWDWGTPMVIGAHSGTNVWGTQLSGNHGGNSEYLTSPIMDLSKNAGQSSVLSWWQWAQIYIPEYAFGQVEVSKDGGNSWTVVYGPVSNIHNATWTKQEVTLDPTYSVSNFRVRFYYEDSIYAVDYGWYIDDVSIKSANNCLPLAGGLVVGNVYNTDTNKGFNNALVTDGAGHTKITAATPGSPILNDGYYTMFLPAGSKNFTASYYGYASDSKTVNISADTVVRQNFNLTPSPIATVHGTVTDGSGHSWPLYAKIDITAPGFATTIYTDPVTGHYNINLYQNTAYTFSVSSSRYTTKTRDISLSAADRTENFALIATCTASGYRGGIYEQFESGVLPDGWTNKSNNSILWRFDNPSFINNGTGGSGKFAIADGWYYYGSSFDTELITPALDFTGVANVALEFNTTANLFHEACYVDVSNDGGATWTNVWNQTEIYSTFSGHVNRDISSVAANQTNVKVRFRYVSDGSAKKWVIDDVKVGNPTCTFVPGGLALGNVYDVSGVGFNNVMVTDGADHFATTTSTPNDPGLDDGFYTLFQPAGNTLLSASYPGFGDLKTVNVVAGSITKQNFNLSTCSAYTILPTNASFASSGGTGSLQVSAGSGCTWSVTSNQSWVTITSGGKWSANGMITFTVSANPTVFPRTAIMTIAGQTFTVTQAAAPHGSLQGTITDAATGNPLSGVPVNVSGGYTAITNSSGFYQITGFLTGVYDITASTFGYPPQTVTGVVISDAAVTTQNIALQSLPVVTIQGTVTDGSGHGWPLYAKIDLSSPGYSKTVYTDPVTGIYSINLYQGIPYTFTVNVTGYSTTSRTITPSSGGNTENFVSIVSICTAPGYRGGIYEQFEGGIPAGWTIKDNTGGGAWRFWGGASDNKTGGGGAFADAYFNGVSVGASVMFDTELTSPSINFSSIGSVSLEFNSDLFIYYDGTADVDVSKDGGATWINVWRRSSFETGPTYKVINISSIAGNQSNVKVRFHLYGVSLRGEWKVDNIKVNGTPCVPVAGGILVGNVYDAVTGTSINNALVSDGTGHSATTAATPSDPGLDDGYYSMFLPAGNMAFTASSPGFVDSKTVNVVPDSVVRQNFNLIKYGVLQGTVTDAATGNPIIGATVTATGGLTTTTDSSGFYQFASIIGGTYEVAASFPYYLTQSVAGVVITNANTSTQNFALSLSNIVTVQGTIADGSGHGWPLYARIEITAPGYSNTIYTDPVTGSYNLSLYRDTNYTFNVSAAGYNTATRTITPPAGINVENIALTVNAVSCTAPGYFAKPLYSETFENNDGGYISSPTNSGGLNRDIVHSGSYAWWLNNAQNIYLTSPTINLSVNAGQTSILSWWQNFMYENSTPSIQVSKNDGASWTSWPIVHKVNLWEQNSIVLDSSYSVSNFRVRFFFPNFAYGYIDDVLVQQYNCQLQPGGLVVGNVYDATASALNNATVTDRAGHTTTSTATPNDPGLADGFYTLFVPAGSRTLIASSPEYGNSNTLNVTANTVTRQNFNLVKNGRLQGTVRSSATGNPISGATVTAIGGYSTTTDSSGFYQFASLPAAPYEVTVSAIYHQSQTLTGIVVNSETTTTADVALNLLPEVTVQGRVTDGSGHGWPLYAKIDIAAPGYANSIYTDPVTGNYSISLYQNTPYTLTVSSPGYGTANRNITSLPGGPSENFILITDATCTAPGYSPYPIIYSESFESSNGGYSVSGNTSWVWGAPIYAYAHSGSRAWQTDFSLDYNNFANNNLTSPNIDLSAHAGQSVSFSWWQWLYADAWVEHVSVEISNNGGVTWSTVYGPTDIFQEIYSEQHNVTLNPSYMVSNFRFRFHFTTAEFRSLFQKNWTIDDVSITRNGCQFLTGGMVVGNVYNAATGAALNNATVTDFAGHLQTTSATSNDQVLADGFYSMFLPAGNVTLAASSPGYGDAKTINVVADSVIRQDFNLASCSYGLLPANPTFNATGGSGSIQLTTNGGCPWSLSNTPSWISITSDLNGIGSGAVSYAVQANSTTSSRTGAITVAGQNYTITQDWAHGSLQGTISSSVTGSPIGGATVTVTGGYSTITNSSGDYSFAAILAGSHDVTVSAYGYQPQTTTGVVINAGGTTTQDQASTPQPVVTVHGSISDNSGHGWPLYAKIDITAFGFSTSIRTSPETGNYSINLYQDTPYTFTVSATDYNSTTRNITPPAAGSTENFALQVASCNAQGYGGTIYSDSFESNNGGYNVITNYGHSTWKWITATSGPGSAHSGSKVWTTDYSYPEVSSQALSSPDIDLSANAGQPSTLSWWQWLKLDYLTAPWAGFPYSFDEAWVSISKDGGANWQSVYGANGNVELSWTKHIIQLDPSYSVPNFRIRFTIDSDLVGGAPGFYIDDVSVQKNECYPLPGGLVVGNIYAADTGLGLNNVAITDSTGRTSASNATPNDPALDDGFYTLFFPAGSVTLTTSYPGYGGAETVNVVADAVVRRNLNLAPCSFAINTTSVSFNGSGGTGTVQVTTGIGCQWTVAENLSWLTITSGSSGMGSGTVGYTVAANAGTSSRSGAITVAGKTVTITQIRQQGTLQGTVTNSASGNPVVGATVTATGGYSTTTNSSGYFQFANVLAGTFEVSVSAFGYQPQTLTGIIVTDGAITTQNLGLNSLPVATVQGAVTDGSGHGWPLYAKIDITTQGYATTIYTDPVTGNYSIELYENKTYSFTVSVSGYSTTTRSIIPLSGGSAENFALIADNLSCTAPGYAPINIHSQSLENDNGGFTASGTTSWEWGLPTSGPNSAHSGTKVWATSLSGHHGQGNGYITSADIDISAKSGQSTVLSWWQWFRGYYYIALSGNAYIDYASVEVSNDGGATWSIVYGPVSRDVDTVWTQHNVLLDPKYSVSNFKVRFHMYGNVLLSLNNQGWYVDDIAIKQNNCQLLTGGIATGKVSDAKTGSGLSNALVVDGMNHTAISSAPNGVYSLFLPAGASTLSTSVSLYGSDSKVVEIAADTVIRQDFNLKQFGTVQGKVTNVATGNPIIGATVTATGGYSTTTDGQGVYRFANKPDGSYSVSVSASGYESQTINGIAIISENITTQDVALTPIAVVMSTGSLPVSPVNIAYSQTMSASSGLAPYTWSIVAGTLPDGLTLNSATGVISGVPATAGKFDFSIQVTGANATSATKSFSISVLGITTVSLPSGVIGSSYSQPLAADGGTVPYTWSITVGSLPAGLTLDSSTGIVSGTPTNSGAFSFIVQAVDAISTKTEKIFTISIFGILTNSIPPISVGVPYRKPLSVAGGTAPFSWSLTAGVLPDGLTLNGLTGVISGTPSMVGKFGFTVQVMDANSLAYAKELNIAVHSGGYVFAFGQNSDGQLGDGTTGNKALPVQTAGLSDVTSIAGGYSHSIALKADGMVWSWGYNSGQLGDGTTINRTSPVEVIGLSGVIAIASGGSHAMALKTDGTVWSCGSNSSGQLGDGTTTKRTSPVNVAGLTDVIAIASGDSHSITLKADGTVWNWGYNYSGQLGDGTTTNRTSPVQVAGLADVIAIAVGSSHSLALKADGTVWSWGYNYYGQLGEGTTTNRSRPVQIAGLSGAIAIAGGNCYSFALLADGTVRSWGYNSLGQLGDGTTTNRYRPVSVKGLSDVTSVAVGNYHVIALKLDGTLWDWGLNSYGQLGDGTTTNRFLPTKVDGLSGVTGIAAGYFHTITLIPFRILTEVLPDGSSAPYTQALSASTGSEPNTWSINAGSRNNHNPIHPGPGNRTLRSYHHWWWI